MANLRNRFPARRRFLKQSAALTASASMAAPMLALAAAGEPAAGEPPQPADDRRPPGTPVAQGAQRDRRPR